MNVKTALVLSVCCAIAGFLGGWQIGEGKTQRPKPRVVRPLPVNQIVVQLNGEPEVVNLSFDSQARIKKLTVATEDLEAFKTTTNGVKGDKVQHWARVVMTADVLIWDIGWDKERISSGQK